MPISRLLQEFDAGVESVVARHRFSRSTLSDIAGFAFFDLDGSGKHKCLKTADECQLSAELWKELYKPLREIFRADDDIKDCYAGFATLFTLNEDVGKGGRYSSVVIDIDSEASGFKNLELSEWQFKKKKTIPLTSVCLNAAYDEKYEALPIMFHWTRPGGNCPRLACKIQESLKTWGHIIITVEVPRDDELGIKMNLNDIDFSGGSGLPLIEVPDVFHDGKIIFDKNEFFRRIRKYQSHVTHTHCTDTDEELARKLVWTVTYFVYGCEEYLRSTPKDCERHLAKNEYLDQLTIVCAPASYGNHVSAALYLPVCCKPPNHKAVAKAAHKTLFLSRALGLPLVQLKEISTKSDEVYASVYNTISHEISKEEDAISDKLLLGFPELAKQTCEELEKITDQVESIKDWKVLVTPRIHQAIALRRLVWLGKNFLGNMHLGENSNMPLEDAIRRLLLKISESYYAGELSSKVTRNQLLKSQTQRKVEEILQKASKNTVEIFMENASIACSYNWAPNNETINDAIMFGRMFSASISNILEKTLKIHLFEIKIDHDSMIVTVTIDNAVAGKIHQKSFGTKGVLKCLVTRIKGAQLLCFGKYENLFRTQFRMPAAFIVPEVL